MPIAEELKRNAAVMKRVKDMSANAAIANLQDLLQEQITSAQRIALFMAIIAIDDLLNFKEVENK